MHDDDDANNHNKCESDAVVQLCTLDVLSASRIKKSSKINCKILFCLPFVYSISSIFSTGWDLARRSCPVVSDIVRVPTILRSFLTWRNFKKTEKDNGMREVDRPESMNDARRKEMSWNTKIKNGSLGMKKKKKKYFLLLAKRRRKIIIIDTQVTNLY